MGIGGGTGVGGGAQPQGIAEEQASAFHEVSKKVLLAMLPPDTLEVIPFTEREMQMVWKYDTTPSHPTLHPLLHLRSAAERAEAAPLEWQGIYDELVNLLPDTLKEILLDDKKLGLLDRQIDLMVMDNIMEATAKILAWLKEITKAPVPGSREDLQNQLNLSLPYIAMRGILSGGFSAIEGAQKQLEGLGANFPGHDAVSGNVKQLDDLMNEMNVLRTGIEKNGIDTDNRLRLTEIADQAKKLDEEYKRTNAGEGFQVVGSILNSFAVITSAMALTMPSAPLLIGLSTATIGLMTAETASNIFGSAFSKIADSIYDGILNSIDIGPRSELNELRGMEQELHALREGG